MHKIDLVNLAFSRLKGAGVELRFVHGDGLSSGLCRVGSRNILFLNDGTTAHEQLDVLAEAFYRLNWDFEQLPAPLRHELESRLASLTNTSAASI